MKENENLVYWQGRYADAKVSYDAERKEMDVRDGYYMGNRTVFDKDGNATKKDSSNVRNIVFELVESQIDSTIPVCRVQAIHREDDAIAKKLEAVMRCLIAKQHIIRLNDLQERVTPVQGGDFFLVEWDNSAGYHCTKGDVSIQSKHPKQIIPQPGVYDLNEMEYVFVTSSVTWQSIKRIYGKDYKSYTETQPTVRTNGNSKDNTPKEDMLTQIDCYFHSTKGIGKCSWIDGAKEPLEYSEDYQARKLERCVRCGKVKYSDVCDCGSKKFKLSDEDGMEITEDITVMGWDGLPHIYPAMGYGEPEFAMNPDGTMQSQVDEFGEPILDSDGYPMPVLLGRKQVRNKIPYYKPNVIPLVLRKNITKYGSFLGMSDVDVIRDQQEAIKKFGDKISEKILKGGSFVTLPEGVKVETTDKELKILRVRTPADRESITVINVQPDISKEQMQLETCYGWAKSTMGITDSFQGKFDSSATSGTAKQFAANQSAGRLMSKRVLKYDAYSQLYEYIFKWLMAYSDDPIPYVTNDENGESVYAHFDPKELLKMDSEGTLYWNDEFIFSVDESATMASNKETIWNMLAVMYQAGAFGLIGQLDTNQIYWTLLEQNGYPGAGTVKRNIEQRLAAQNQMIAEQASMSIPDTGDGIDDRTSVQQSDLTNLNEVM